jgi:BirA family biotin operon repressor/biotin-[acetyl-CoA-carboxylase] ligase
MSRSLFPLLQQINQEAYLPLETIAQRLGTNPQAILEQLTHLHQYGALDIDPQKGYRLQQPTSLLNPLTLQTTNWKYPVEIDYFVSLDSTNDYLMHDARVTNRTHICLAEHQTKGRGRFDRQWASPFAENIYLSIKTTLNSTVHAVTTLSPTIAVIIAQMLVALYNFIIPQIKWPNDLYIDGKKLSGNLIEIKSSCQQQTEVVIGIGLNVNMVMQPKIDQLWTSLRQALGKVIDRTTVTIALINSVLDGLAIFEQAGFQAFSGTYKQYDCLLGRKVKLQSTKATIEGIGVGVNDQGQLLLITDQGVKGFNAGETSIVKN